MSGWSVERELRGAAAPGSDREGSRGGFRCVDAVLEFQLQLFLSPAFSDESLEPEVPEVPRWSVHRVKSWHQIF